MAVGTIGYLISHLNVNPSLLKSSWALTLYSKKGARYFRTHNLYIELIPLVTKAVEHGGISVQIYTTNYR